MTYRKIKRLSLQTNSERCLVLRSLYAKTMLGLLHQDYRVINVDESWLSTNDCRHSKWGPRGKPNTLSMPFLGSKVNMIGALDSNGQVYLSVLQANVDTEVFLTFMTRLTKLLDLKESNWRPRTFFLLDGASYHRNPEALATMKALGLHVLISAPYSFDGAPVEKLFALIKQGRLTTDAMKTGKRQFRLVASLLARRASTLSTASLRRLWLSSTVALTRYLTFHRV